MLVYSNKKWILIDIIETIVKKKKKNFDSQVFYLWSSPSYLLHQGRFTLMLHEQIHPAGQSHKLVPDL